MKQAADLRRARRQHVVEMLHLAKRPFAQIFLASASLDLDNSPHAASSSTTRAMRQRARQALLLQQHQSQQSESQPHGHLAHHSSSSSHCTRPVQATEIMLVAIEPTCDNLAAVGTVFVSLPGRSKAPLSIALGSTLISYPRQYPLNSRHFMRAAIAEIISSKGISSSSVPQIIEPALSFIINGMQQELVNSIDYICNKYVSVCGLYT